MNWIEGFFVRAKHWQLFFLFLATFAATEFVAFGSFSAAKKSPEEAPTALLLMATLTGLGVLCFLLWLWSVGSFLSSIVQPAFRLRTVFFLFSVVYSSVYVFAFGAIFQSINAKLIAVIIPLHLFAMYCIFYCMAFVAKNLVMAESGKRVTFYDYAGPFFLVWFYFIGVWFIQPRINRLYAEKPSAEATT